MESSGPYQETPITAEAISPQPMRAGTPNYPPNIPRRRVHPIALLITLALLAHV